MKKDTFGAVFKNNITKREVRPIMIHVIIFQPLFTNKSSLIKKMLIQTDFMIKKIGKIFMLMFNLHKLIKRN